MVLWVETGPEVEVVIVTDVLTYHRTCEMFTTVTLLM